MQNAKDDLSNPVQQNIKKRMLPSHFPLLNARPMRQHRAKQGCGVSPRIYYYLYIYYLFLYHMAVYFGRKAIYFDRQARIYFARRIRSSFVWRRASRPARNNRQKWLNRNDDRDANALPHREAWYKNRIHSHAAIRDSPRFPVSSDICETMCFWFLRILPQRQVIKRIDSYCYLQRDTNIVEVRTVLAFCWPPSIHYWKPRENSLSQVSCEHKSTFDSHKF